MKARVACNNKKGGSSSSRRRMRRRRRRRPNAKSQTIKLGT
jgi:hypothetical protein